MDTRVALEVFSGVMIGDGGLNRALFAADPPEMCYGVKHSRFTLNQSTEHGDHMDWLLFVKEALTELGVSVSSGYPKYCTVRTRGKTFGSSKLLTLTSSWLTYQRRVWYPNGYNEVFRGFQFTPISLANAWMSDGNATRDKGSPITVNLHLELQDFSMASIAILENSPHNIGLHTGRGVESRGKSGVRVTILQDSVDSFMDIIKHWILPSFMYKVKYKNC